MLTCRKQETKLLPVLTLQYCKDARGAMKTFDNSGEKYGL
jgi:hypothetical protein